jgi:hypothetical protein
MCIKTSNGIESDDTSFSWFCKPISLSVFDFDFVFVKNLKCESLRKEEEEEEEER